MKLSLSSSETILYPGGSFPLFLFLKFVKKLQTSFDIEELFAVQTVRVMRFDWVGGAGTGHLSVWSALPGLVVMMLSRTAV